MNNNTESETIVVVDGQLNPITPDLNGLSATSLNKMSIEVSKPNISSSRLIKRAEISKERRTFADESSNEGATSLKEEPVASKATESEGALTLGSPLLTDCKANDYKDIRKPLISKYESYSETEEYSDVEPIDNITETYQFLNEYPRMRIAFFSVLPVFMAYSSLVTLQGNLKHHLGIHDHKSARSYEFSNAVSLLFLGNLFFRLLHNAVFGFLRPRQRVYMSYVAITVACGTIAIFYFMLNLQTIAFMYIAYFIAGIGIGTFESNIMSVLTPLGHETKVWAQFGIPVGFCVVSVGTFIILIFLPHNATVLIFVYSGIAISNIMGLIFFKFCIPDVHFAASEQNFKDLFKDLKKFKEWLPKICFYSLAFAVNMFCVSVGASLQQFMYESDALPLVYGSDVTMPKNVHRVLVNLMSLFGDVTGRKIAYYIKRKVHPLWYLITVIGGVTILLSKQAIIAPIGMFVLFLSNGLIYASTTKHIDIDVDPEYNLVALSVWLFIGDIGSFIGSNLVNPLLVAFGSV